MKQEDEIEYRLVNDYQTSLHMLLDDYGIKLSKKEENDLVIEIMVISALALGGKNELHN